MPSNLASTLIDQGGCLRTMSGGCMSHAGVGHLSVVASVLELVGAGLWIAPVCWGIVEWLRWSTARRSVWQPVFTSLVLLCIYAWSLSVVGGSLP